MCDEGGERDAALAAALAGRLRASGLARVADDLLALAQPAIHLDLRRVVHLQAYQLKKQPYFFNTK